MNNEARGFIYIISGMLITSFFPILATILLKSLPSLTAITYSMFVAMVYFFFFSIFTNEIKQFPKFLIDKNNFLGGFYIGVLFEIFFYIGLSFLLDPNTASILMLLQIFMAYVLMILWRKEKFDLIKSIGAVFMTSSAALIVLKGSFEVSIGVLFLFLSSISTTFGNYYQKQAVPYTKTHMMLFVRTFLSFFLIGSLALYFNYKSFFYITPKLFLIATILGISFYIVQKISFVEGLRYLEVTTASTLFAFIPFFTLIFSFLFFGVSPTSTHLISILLMCFGFFLIVKAKNLRRRILRLL